MCTEYLKRDLLLWLTFDASYLNPSVENLARSAFTNA